MGQLEAIIPIDEPAFRGMVAKKVRIRRQQREMELQLACDRYLSRQEVARLAQKCREYYTLNHVTLQIGYPAELFGSDGFVWLADMLCEKFPACRSLLANARWHWSHDGRLLCIETAGMEEWLGLCDRWLTDFVLETHGLEIQVRRQTDIPANCQAHTPIAALKEQTQTDRPADPAGTERPEPPKPPKPVKPPPKKESIGEAPGKKAVPIGDLAITGRTVTVEGCVFSKNHRPSTKHSNKLNIEFCIFDDSGAVRVRYYPRGGKSRELDTYALAAKALKGKTLRVTGRLKESYREEEEPYFDLYGLAETETACRRDNAEQKRVELHMHTAMSALDAVSDVKKIIETAARWGHKAVAITDHGVVHSFPEAYAEAKKHPDVKVIYGCEGYLLDDAGKDTHHIILLAKDQIGLRNLYKMVSESHIRHFYRRPRIPRGLLTAHREGLIVGAACERGELFGAVVRGLPLEQLLEIASFYDYLEIQPICNNAFMIDNGTAQDEEQLRQFNRTVVEVGTALDKPVCATGDAHFIEPEDEIYRSMLLANMKMLKERPTPLYFRTTQEMLDEFAYLGRETARRVVIEAPNAVADQVQIVAPVPSGEFFPKIEGSAEELQTLTLEGARRYYGENWPPMLKERLDKELNAIIGHGYAVIYISAQRLVARSVERGYMVGSRGSVGSSIVAFFTGITEVNTLPPHYRCLGCLGWEFPQNHDAACGPDLPDRDCPRCQKPYLKDGYDISFAIFLGFEADKKPDIDLNFSGDYQAEAHRHTLEIFGAENVYRAGTVSTVAEKTALQFVDKYIELTGEEMGEVNKARLASGCVGVKRSSGQHPGGMIIVPEGMDINDFCPVHHPANNKESGVVTTHFDYHAIEENLLKLDLLGHDNPTVLKMLEELTGIGIGEIPLGDPGIVRLFTDSSVLGYQNDEILGPTGAVAIPEFGTSFVRGMLKTARPGTFDELIRISGLSHGEEVWLRNAEELIRSNTATLKNVVGCRDDILSFLTKYEVDKLAAFVMMEQVRRGKGLTEEQQAVLRRCKVPEWYIESLKKIKYLFPRSHAAAYVISAFQIAWFKVHHPLAFYSAFFSIRAKAFDLNCLGAAAAKKQYKILLAKKERTGREGDMMDTCEVIYEYFLRGFHFLPVDLYKSDAEKFIIEDGALRLPFIAVDGLGEIAAAELVRERAEPFLAVDELKARCGKLTKTHVAALRALGALDALPESMQVEMFG